PDYRPEGKTTLRVGPNKGNVVPEEIANILETRSRLLHPDVAEKPSDPDIEVDLLIVGGGGAGIVAALFAKETGASVLLATKLRIGDSNTVMAEGGIQVALGDDDSPAQHLKDAYRGGHFTAILSFSVLVKEGPEVISWLVKKGV
ncbi:protein containing Fumarate reductase/succinate dehydrogenase flavoprotein, partial [mine drainage metagenome]